MSERTPQHMQLITSGLRWDWRKENPIELVLLVFILAVFFTFPRQGCGVTSKTRLLTPAEKRRTVQINRARIGTDKKAPNVIKIKPNRNRN